MYRARCTITQNDSDPAGGTLESLFEQTGEHADVYAVAAKQVMSWQLEQSLTPRQIGHVTEA